MKIDVLRGVRLGCLGSLCFSIPPLVLALVIAATVDLSTGDSPGSRALGLGVLLFFIGNGSWAAFVALAALAATGTPPARGTVARIGGIAGALFSATVTTGSGITKAWLLPVTSALLVLAAWVSWQCIQYKLKA